MKKYLLLTITLFSLSFGVGAKYLIITHDRFYDAIKPLAEWKQKKGIPTKIVKLSDIPADSSNTTLIRNYIINAYNTWSPRPEYVLLVGAPNYLYGWLLSGSYYTDNNYGDVTGNYLVEIPVGRFPCATASQCSLHVVKTLAYERTPDLADTTWFRKGTTFIREDYSSYPPTNSDTVYWNDTRYASAFWQSAGYMQIDSFSKNAPFSNTGTDVVNAINDGRSFVLFRGQSTGNWWSPYTVDPDNTNNGLKLPIITSVTCYTMTLTPSSPSGDQADRFLNAGSVSNPKGAVGFLATTVSASATGLARCRGTVGQAFYKAIFGEKVYKLGDAVKRAKFVLDSLHPTVYDYNIRYKEWNLLGDPELNIWTGVPRQLTVTHDTLIYTGPQNYTITVKRGATPLSGALVCVMLDTIIYQYNYTNSSGQVTFSINPPTPDTMSVTVTSVNCIPYEKNVVVRIGGNVHDVSVYSIIAPTGTVGAGASITPKALIKNWGSYTDTFPVTFKIGSVYTNTISQVILAAGDTVTKSFPNWTAVLGSYTTKAYTGLGNDQWRANDTAFGTVEVVALHDVGALSILAPKDSICQGVTIKPKVVIKNFGASSEIFSATFKIGSGYTQTVSSISLNAGVTDTIEFAGWLTSIGSYATKCYTQLGSDNNQSNDTVTGSVVIRSEYIVEGFNNATFPPSGWTTAILDGTYDWQRATSGTNPFCSPFEGTGMAFYNSYLAAPGSQVRLISPAIDLGIAPTRIQIKFNMYHDPGYATYQDSIIIEYSTDSINFNPVTGYRRYEPVAGWSEHSVTIGPFTDVIYIGFKAYGQYGDNMYMDNVRMLIPPAGDAGVVNVSSPSGRLVIGVPLNVTAAIKNYGAYNETFPVKARLTDSITGAPIFSKDTTISLLSDSTLQITFGQFTPTADKVYECKVYTALSGDGYIANDTLITHAKTTPASEPDGAGYVYETTQDSIYGDTVSFNWINATSDVELTGWSPNSDAGTIRRALPFSFPYYGQALDSIVICTNGFLQYPTAYRFTNSAMPYASANNLIAGLWDDLDLTGGTRGKVYQYNDPGNQFVVFQFDSVPYYGQDTARNTFQMILYRNGNIKFQYRRVSPLVGNGSTIGTQGLTGVNSCYQQYVYNGTPVSHRPVANTAILFYAKKDVGTASIMEPTGVVDSGAIITPHAIVHNYGPIQQTFDVRFEINDGYSNTQSVTVGGNSQTIVGFSPWTASYFGTFSTKCSTRFSEDQYAGNNKLTGSVHVKFHDVGAYEIVAPHDSQYAGNLAVSAKVKNYYTRIASCSTRFIIRNQTDAIVYNQSQYVQGLLPDSIRTLTFNDFPAVPGAYHTQVFTKLLTDDNAANDTLNGSFVVTLAAPLLSSPSQSETLLVSTPLFNWQDVYAASQYQIQVDNDIDFLSPVIDLIVSISELQTSTPGLIGGNYYWRVRAGTPNSSWSEVREFTIDATIPEPPEPPGWTQKSVTPSRVPGKSVKDGGAMVAVGNGVYAFRGYKSNEFYRFDSLGWSLKESLQFGRKPTDPSRINKKKVTKGGALCYDGVNMIYATKGSRTREFWVYNISANNWTAKAFVPPVKGLKGGTGLAFQNGKVYLLAGGRKYGEPNFYVYDTLTNSWASLNNAPMPDGKPYKDGSCIVLFDDTIFALKGSGKDNYFSAYNISTSNWSLRNLMPLIDTRIDRKKKVKIGGAMTTDGSVIYATKGGGTNEFWVYLPGSNNWLQSDTIPRRHKKSVPKSGAAIAYTNNKLYLLKGNNLNEFWQYVPEQISNIKNQISKTNTSIQTEEVLNQVPNDILFTVTPNPFIKSSVIRYTLPVSSNVSIKLYNSAGELIETLIDTYQGCGSYSLNIDNRRSEISKGIYFLRFETINNKQEVKIIKI